MMSAGRSEAAEILSHTARLRGQAAPNNNNNNNMTTTLKTTRGRKPLNGAGEHENTGAAMPPLLETESLGIVLPRLDTRILEIKLEGTSPLITHAWSEKAKKMMRDKQQGKASAGKENKNPEQEMRGAMYLTADGKPGVPAISFKNAAVTACTSLGKSITKVAARQAFHVVGDIIPITGEPRMREDMVRVGMGVADIRYRPEFHPWSVVLQVQYNARVISAEQLVNLDRKSVV